MFTHSAILLSGAGAPDDDAVSAPIGTFYDQRGTTIRWVKYGLNDYNWTPYSCDPRDGYIYRDDLLSSGLATSNSLGGGSGIFTGEANHPGVVTQQVTSTVTPDRNRIFFLGGGSPLTGIVAGTGKIYMEILSKFPTLSDGVDDFSWRGPGMDVLVTGDATAGIYFENDNQVHGNNNWFGCTANGGIRTKTDLLVAPVAGVYQRLRWEDDALNTSARFLINDTFISANVANMPATGFGACPQLIKTLGILVARQAVLDHFYCAILLTTPR